MKKLWLWAFLLSTALNICLILYIAVGAVPQKDACNAPVIEKESDSTQQAMIAKKTELLEKEVPLYFLDDEALKITFLANSYHTDRMYEMDYTVKRAYFSKKLPDGTSEKELCGMEDITLGEGYTFLLVDVIIESKDSEKQMYIVNSASLNGYSLCGFVGQEYKNSAALHRELLPGEPFETTLIFAVKSDMKEVYQLYINNFGYGSPNGTCAYIELYPE